MREVERYILFITTHEDGECYVDLGKQITKNYYEKLKKMVDEGRYEELKEEVKKVFEVGSDVKFIALSHYTKEKWRYYFVYLEGEIKVVKREREVKCDLDWF